MRKLTTLLLVVLTVALLAAVVALSFHARSRGQLVKAQSVVTPFTLTFTTHSPKPQDGFPALTRTTAVRSDGAMALLQVDNRRAGTPVTWLRIFTPDGRFESSVVELRAKYTMKLPSEEVQSVLTHRATAPYNCVPTNWTFGGILPQEFQGLKVAKVFQVIPRDIASGGDIRITKYRAPALGCQELWYTSEIKDADGAYQLAAFSKVDSLVLGEPDPSLFRFHDGFIEEKPSEFTAAILQRTGKEMCDAARKNVQQWDQVYADRQ